MRSRFFYMKKYKRIVLVQKRDYLYGLISFLGHILIVHCFSILILWVTFPAIYGVVNGGTRLFFMILSLPICCLYLVSLFRLGKFLFRSFVYVRVEVEGDSTKILVCYLSFIFVVIKLIFPLSDVIFRIKPYGEGNSYCIEMEMVKENKFVTLMVNLNEHVCCDIQARWNCNVPLLVVQRKKSKMSKESKVSG